MYNSIQLVCFSLQVVFCQYQSQGGTYVITGQACLKKVIYTGDTLARSHSEMKRSGIELPGSDIGTVTPLKTSSQSAPVGSQSAYL